MRYNQILCYSIAVLLIAGFINDTMATPTFIDHEHRGSFTYSGSADFLNELKTDIRNVLTAEEFRSDDINFIVNQVSVLGGVISASEDYNAFKYVMRAIADYDPDPSVPLVVNDPASLPPEYTVYLRFYILGCLLPQEEPLIIGQDVTCWVGYLEGYRVITTYVLPVTEGGSFHRVLDMYTTDPSGDEVTIIESDSDHYPFVYLTWPGLMEEITLNEIGEWTVGSTYKSTFRPSDPTEGDIEVISLNLEVTLMVIPESIIGVAGIIAGPLAVLAYKLRKKSSK